MAFEADDAGDGPGQRHAERGGGGGERGSASIVVLAVGLAIMMVGLTAMTLGSVIHARHRAQVGADAAALAGAMRIAEGAPTACDRAAELAAANNTVLADCAVNGGEVAVRAQVSLPEPLQQWGVVSAVAVAAPADPEVFDAVCPSC